jgi:hypothetical protein
MAAAHLVVTATRWSALSQKERADTREYGFLLAAAVVFWALSSRNPRGAEYAIPLTALVLAAGLRQAPRARLVVPAVLALALAVQIPRMAAQVRAMAGPPNERSANALLALEAIPRQAGGLLFNCEWDLSPYVLYARPGLRFLDILDPSLLQTASPHLHQSRQRLLAGDVADPYFMLKGGLRADYVLCRSRAVVAQLQSDPLFVPLSPAAGQGSSPETPVLFKLAEVPGSSFVRDFEVTPPSSLLQEGLPDAQTAWAPLPGPPQAMPVRSADLGEYLRAAQASGSPSVVCAAVRPSATAVAQHAGKTLIGIGGGRNVRVWLNGEPFYASGTAFEKPRLVQQLAALPRPLTPADRIEAVVCSRSDASFLLLALSFWDQGEVDSICRAKGWTEPPAPKGGLGWRFRGNPAQTCLGPVAASGASAPQ